MNNVIRKFAFFAEFAVFILLALLLSVINTVNFAMASDDADFITQRIAEDKGMFGADRDRTPSDMQQFDQNKNFRPGGKKFGGLESMGPDSPEMSSSIRYFTYAFDNSGNAQKIVFKMSAVTENEAQEWAKGLLGKTVGWTNVNYRYRVYEIDGMTYVTVIDQGRELLPSYRILIISVCGELLGLLASFIVLESISKKLVRPLEDADRKQRQFISNVEKEFKLPLTVINANTEIIEKESGCTDYTRSINRQVRRMTSLVKDLRALSVINDDSDNITEIDFSEIMTAVLDGSREKFKERNIKLSMDIEENIKVNGDEERVRRVIRELSDNSLLFGKTEARFTLTRDSERITLNQYNDTQLPEGTVDQVFDRFITLENADNYDTAGLGLSYVKDTVKSMGGRVSAKVSDGVFMLTIAL